MPNLETKNDDAPLSVQQVAHRLVVSEMTIRRMIDRGELRAFRVGRVLRIPAR